MKQKKKLIVYLLQKSDFFFIGSIEITKDTIFVFQMNRDKNIVIFILKDG